MVSSASFSSATSASSAAAASALPTTQFFRFALLRLSVFLLVPLLLPLPHHLHPSSAFHPPPASMMPSAHALPVSMWRSMSSYYPLSALISRTQGRRWTAPQPQQQQRRAEEAERRKAEAVVPVPEAEDDAPEVDEERTEEETEEANNALTDGAGGGIAKPKFGTLKLCPPGGRSFFEAYELACPMRRRRRKKRNAAFDDYDEEEADVTEADALHQQQQQFRPANISEIMQICCARGCEIADFFPHCGPFSLW